MNNNEFYSLKDKILNNDNILAALLLLLTIGVVYYTPYLFSQIYFIILIYFAYQSDKNYFWIAFFFILLDAPGRLFLGGLEEDIRQIPNYTLPGGLSIAFTDIMTLVLFTKALKSEKQYKFIFSDHFILLFYYSIFLIIYSYILGLNFGNTVHLIRIFIPWSLIFILPKIFDKESMENFDKILFPFVFIALLTQIHTFVSGSYLIEIIKMSESVSSSNLLVAQEQVSRAASSPYIIFYCFIKSLYYYFSDNNRFDQIYLFAIAACSILSIFLTATRGWILAFTFILLFVLVKLVRNKYSIQFGKATVFTMVIFLFAFNLSPTLKTQTVNTVNRLSTLRALFYGDLTADGTLSRLDYRGPRVLSKYIEKPILGWGFSNTFYDYRDQHVGHHTMLLNVGILGFVILNTILLLIIYQMYNSEETLKVISEHGKGIIIFAISLIAVFIIHSSSRSFWGFVIPNYAAKLTLILFLFNYSLIAVPAHKNTN